MFTPTKQVVLSLAANSFELGGSEVSSVASHGSFMRAVRAAQAAAEQVTPCCSAL